MVWPTKEQAEARLGLLARVRARCWFAYIEPRLHQTERTGALRFSNFSDDELRTTVVTSVLSMTTRSRVLEDEMDRRGLSSDGPILRPPFPAPMPEMEGIVLVRPGKSAQVAERSPQTAASSTLDRRR